MDERTKQRQRESLLQRVMEAPDDDAPRLVFADWLLERNDPRGELIQVQIALARGARDDGLLVRQRQLFNQFKNKWLKPLAPRVTPMHMHRGFPDGLWVGTDELVEHAAAIWKRTPISKVMLSHRGSLPPAAAIDLVQLEYLRELTLEGTGGEPSLLDSPHLSKLRSLSIRSSPPSSALPLRTARHLHAVRSLGFADTRIGDDGAIAVSEARSLDGVEALYVRNANLTDRGAAALVQSTHLPALKTLILSADDEQGGGNRIGLRGVQTIAASSELARIRNLWLIGNPIGPGGAEAFAASPYTTGLRELRLEQTGTDSAGVVALSNAVGLKNLTLLGLRDNPIDPAAALALVTNEAALPMLETLTLPYSARSPEVDEANKRRARPIRIV